MPPAESDFAKRAWDLPAYRESFEVYHGGIALTKAQRLENQHGTNRISQVFDVKFYPYTSPKVDPVFALVASRNILVFRPNKEKSQIPDLLCVINDMGSSPLDDNTEYSSIVWTKNMKTGTPLLCVSGNSKVIKIFNALTGEEEMALPGHGGDINDLAICPTNPEVLASCSADWTIRLWNLSPAFSENPCVAILAGEAHHHTILTIAFHNTGNFLLSGGQDSIVNLWSIPALPTAPSTTPLSISSPAFTTSDLHTDIVDCVAFYSDLLLSKAFNENCIVLTEITNFNSSVAPPPPSSFPPNPSLPTRSAFCDPADGPPYTRLLQFDYPGGNEFYMRFSLHSPLHNSANGDRQHPILAICNSASKVFFWDLDRIQGYAEHKQEIADANAEAEFATSSELGSPKKAVVRPHWLTPFRSRQGDGGGGLKEGLGRKALGGHRDTDDTSSTTGSLVTEMSGMSMGPGRVMEADWKKTVEGWEGKYRVDDPLGGGVRPKIKNPDEEGDRGDNDEIVEKPQKKGKGKSGEQKKAQSHGLQPHRTEIVKQYNVQGRQVAWSVGGEWCVVVGSPNAVGIFWRWNGVCI